MNKTICITGGKTGGHIFPGLAVAKNIVKNGKKVYFLSPYNKLDKDILKKNNIDFYCVLSWYPGKIISLNFLKFILFNILGIFQSLYYLIKTKTSVIIGLGGFPSFPAVIAGIILRKKIILLEQNVFPGKANLFLIKFAYKICISFEETNKYISKKYFKKVNLTGNPIREEIISIELLNKQDIFKKNNLIMDKKILLIIGGSQGASVINKFICANIDELIINFQIIHITGADEYENILFFYKNKKNVFAIPFTEEIHELMYISDLIISRAGATTIAEFIYLNKKSILIPFSFCNDKHQYKNAEILVKKGLSIIINENELSLKNLKENIEKLLNTNIEISLDRKNNAVKQISDLI